MTTISVLVVNYNGGDLLAQTLESLLRQTRAADEIIVVDNGSTDGSIDVLESRFPSVRLIRSPENVGFTGGNNLALGHSSGDLIALINSDAVADERWLESLAQTLEAEPGAAVAEGKILFPTTPPRIDQAGGEFNDLGNYWGRGYGEVDRGQYDAPADVAGVTGCAMMLRRSALGGEPLFDDAIFMYGEELDLTIRLRSRGYRIVYTPRAVVIHRGMHSLQRSQSNPRLFQQFHANRNRLKIIFSYYPLRTLFAKLPLITLGIAYWNLYFLRHGGIRFLVRSLVSETRSVADGIAARRAAARGRELWLPWMQRHRLRDVLAMKRRMSGQGS